MNPNPDVNSNPNPNNNRRRLYRSEKDKKICGVCGGLADYFDMDSSMMRVIAILVILFAGSGLLAYIILALVLPTESEVK